MLQETEVIQYKFLYQFLKFCHVQFNFELHSNMVTRRCKTFVDNATANKTI